MSWARKLLNMCTEAHSYMCRGIYFNFSGERFNWLISKFRLWNPEMELRWLYKIKTTSHKKKFITAVKLHTFYILSKLSHLPSAINSTLRYFNQYHKIFSPYFFVFIISRHFLLYCYTTIAPTFPHLSQAQGRIRNIIRLKQAFIWNNSLI